MPSRTSHTITEPGRFAEELTRIRAQGFALDDEEHEEGVRCLAVPVRDGSGQVVASLSVSGPVTRLGDEQIRAFTAEVLECGTQLSSRLGYVAQAVAAN